MLGSRVVRFAGKNFGSYEAKMLFISVSREA
jgi:hypothetical protein